MCGSKDRAKNLLSKGKFSAFKLVSAACSANYVVFLRRIIVYMEQQPAIKMSGFSKVRASSTEVLRTTRRTGKRARIQHILAWEWRARVLGSGREWLVENEVFFVNNSS